MNDLPPLRFAPFDLEAGELADLYDELPLWSAPFAQLLLEHVPLRRGLSVLDVGAGTGFLSVELAQRCGPDARVWAVDPWRAASRRLAKKVRFLELDNVSIEVCPVERVDLPERSIDLVVSNLGINNFADPEAALAACFRLSKPGGTLAITTNLVGHMAELYETYRSSLLEIGLADRVPALDRHVSHRGTLEQQRARVQAAGYAVSKVQEGAFSLRYADGASLLRHHFIRLGFLPAWAEIVPEAQRQEAVSALERALDRRAERLGELTLTVPMALILARRP